jgi:hypothetical protein
LSFQERAATEAAVVNAKSAAMTCFGPAGSASLLVFCGTAGGRGGNVGRLDNSVQQVAECHQITQGQYDASPHYGLWIDDSGSKYIASVGPGVSKGEGGELTRHRNVELPVAKRFWNAIRIYHRRLIRWLVEH